LGEVSRAPLGADEVQLAQRFNYFPKSPLCVIN
jgi:hypothetical protein